ncbi:hypothetical protein D3C81_1938170 [compost metagenome]
MSIYFRTHARFARHRFQDQHKRMVLQPRTQIAAHIQKTAVCSPQATPIAPILSQVQLQYTTQILVPLLPLM